MKTELIISVLVAFLLALLFILPLWTMWTVKELFGLDWSEKYWAVFSLILIIGLLLNSKTK